MRGGPNPPGTVSCLLCPQSGEKEDYDYDYDDDVEDTKDEEDEEDEEDEVEEWKKTKLEGGWKLAREGDGIEGMLECERNLEMEASAATAAASAGAAAAAASRHERGGENEEAVGRPVRSE
uniref:Uncharacterized protein n=1 Tax=Vespula pensylvanica TaxID=30213 RepID=A0A834P3L5_VESPE|nr:hypothetical protein H0235_008277 [Vespula pensylvanica]